MRLLFRRSTTVSTGNHVVDWWSSVSTLSRHYHVVTEAMFRGNVDEADDNDDTGDDAQTSRRKKNGSRCDC